LQTFELNDLVAEAAGPGGRREARARLKRHLRCSLWMKWPTTTGQRVRWSPGRTAPSQR
jgi:hypothetical protein